MAKQTLVDVDRLDLILSKLERLESLAQPEKIDSEYINEKKAAALMGYSNCEYFRRQVKNQSLPIRYSTIKGRSYQYKLKDINKYLDQHSLKITA